MLEDFRTPGDYLQKYHQMIQAAKHSLSPVPRSSRWFLQSFRTFSLSLWAGLGFFRIISGWQISSAKFGWLLMELSQNYVKLLSPSSLSKNTWQNDNLQSRYFNFCLTFTLGCCHYMPSCCHGILLQPGVSPPSDGLLLQLLGEMLLHSPHLTQDPLEFLQQKIHQNIL